ncbi:hypothetical protein AAFC00_004051 [Neodothiora populina]
MSAGEMSMQIQIDKQAEAMRLQHQAFVAERESWQLERDRLYRRIIALESLLKGSTNGHSPARSPLVSPHSGNTLTPPTFRNAASNPASRLASIAEVESTSPVGENRPPLSQLKRASAPTHISIPFEATNPSMDVSTARSKNGSEMIDEVPRSPPQTRATLSPPPPANLHHAGHTPLRASISGDMSPARSNFDGHQDTPTRSNTALNEALTEDMEDDRPLKGPLMLPELPYQPDQENFTMSMLSAKLQDLIEHPEDSEPMVLKTPSPGYSAAMEAGEGNFETPPKDDAALLKPETASAENASEMLSPELKPLEDGGIKLRKKPSCNFGAPLGQLHPVWKP